MGNLREAEIVQGTDRMRAYSTDLKERLVRAVTDVPPMREAVRRPPRLLLVCSLERARHRASVVPILPMYGVVAVACVRTAYHMGRVLTPDLGAAA